MAELVGYGFVLGSIITLGAVGLTLIYGIVNFGNFSHGDLMTLGAYLALLLTARIFPALGISDRPLSPLSFGWVMLLSFIPAMAVTGLVALVADRLVYRPLRRLEVKPVFLAISSLAVALVLRSLVYILWGPDYHFLIHGLRPMLRLPLGVKLRPDQVFIIIIAWAMVAGLYLFLQRTKIGKALRAMADNPNLARITGIPTERMTILVWFIGGSMAAAGGILLGIDSQVRPTMGWALLLPLFAAIVLGGIGNPYGALVGGLVLGIVQQASTMWLLPSYKPAVAFLVLILILMFRPQGIFGGT
ncbi:MAG: branched-chain amino acid ABC transporter permease [Chloroflexota bacterium]|nr:branched-chain amino acid ABC transporter permease [Chloroflexota bacterium]